MSEQMTLPAAGVTHLVIETINRHAQVRGSAGDAIHVRYWSDNGEEAPRLTVEGHTAYLTCDDLVRVLLPPGMAVTVKHAADDLEVTDLAAEVNLEVVGGDLGLEHLRGIVRVAQVDGDVRADAVADLRVLGRCAGDLRFENGGSLNAEQVSGDVRVAGADMVRLNRVRGDIWAEKVQGELHIGRADGDTRLSDVSGPSTVQNLSGDLRCSGMVGGLAAAHVAGDVSLSGPFRAERVYVLAADGDILLHLPADADVRLSVRAAGRIRSEPRLIPAANGSPVFTAVIGTGAARINLEGGSDVRIKHAGNQAARLEEPGSWSGPESVGDLKERIRQQVSASLAAAGINIETGEGRWGRSPRPPQPPRPASPPPPARPTSPAAPSSEEQLAVLKMLEAGHITAEQAEALLKALGA